MRAALGLVVLAFVAAELGCVNHAPNPDPARATISGRLTVSGSASPTGDRVLVASETNTGKTYRTQTNNVGDYTFLLPPGRYRIDVTLRPNEELAKKNPVLEIHRGDMKADVNIAVVARPGHEHAG